MSEPSSTPHPSGSPLTELARAITAGAVRLAAATAAWLRLVAEFDERGGWHGWGTRSCGHWLSWQCGLAPGAAREHVRVARALQSLPLVEAAFADGRLSYSKVRALTRIAEPDTEQPLLDLAVTVTAAQLERFVRSWRRADRPDTDRPESRESFDHSWDDDGMLVLRLRMRPEPGAEVLAAIESVAEREARRERAQNARTRAAGPAQGSDRQERQELHRRCADDDELAGLARERSTARRLSALASLARAGVDADRRPGDPPRREVVVHVDAAVLADDSAAGRAHLDGGPALTAAQARRVLCDATVVTMLERGRQPLALGRRRRRASKGQRRALLRRDGGCARPGCPETRIERLHAHHLRHWLFGGRTDLTNLVLLCDVDHGLVHDLDLVMTRVDGRLVVTAPDGRHVWGTADAAFDGGLAGLDDHPVAGDAADGPTTADPFTGVHPIDAEIGRRPVAARCQSGEAQPTRSAQRRRTTAGRRGSGSSRPGGPAPRPRRSPAGPRAGRAPARPRRSGSVQQGVAAMRQALFPVGEPSLADTMPVSGERMDLRYAVGVLMNHRDLLRRLAGGNGATGNEGTGHGAPHT
ncbi:HNH endonuclease [Geodermatophilus tzadiensis]|uniref:HNH endonuclease n=1 Tax=Geodermatophilus tzadiensis TaxID=1137988 RepID=A0A2T0T3J7_9ACTN|nr:HNH endonuclease signature motif containing protein [Geodermatophilus tzadiensis]PRY40211.1 HNH endonuclease [Geodermatophilus tzadiensis]